MENNKGKKNILIITGIAMLLVTLIGATFAWFAITAGNNNANLVTTGTLQIRYTDTSNLYANNLKPATDAQVLEAFNSTTNKCIYVNDVYNGVVGEQICAYNTFTITNIGSLTAYVDVLLEDITNTYVDLKYALFETVPQTLTGTSLTDVSTLVSGVEMLKNTSKTYTLLIWLDERATLETITNKSFGAKITANAITTTNKNLDTSGANAPVLADGMIPISYKSCSEIDSPSYEMYPGCYNEVYENINDTDRAGFQTYCVNDLGSSSEDCEHDINELVTNGELVYRDGVDVVLTLDYFISMYESSGYTMTTEKTKVLSLENYITYVADSNNIDIPYKWYDYNNKQWANAVMVSSATRDAYMNAAEGTTVKEEDILAYYVWIPRYKYQLFNEANVMPQSAIINENNAINTLEYKNDITIHLNEVDLNGYEQLINVVFEKGTASTGNVTCSVSEIGVETCTNKANGNWYTHPAFTFGNEELQGLWVGKFETTGTSSSPTVKPGQVSLRNLNVSQMHTSSKYFQTSRYVSNESVEKLDAHMMKNIEWGAVAYLKQSAYGLGTTDITLNSNFIGLTGCGPHSAGSSSMSTACNAYHTTLGMSTSTTGNITGVYDMAGGAWEYTMGVIQDNTTASRSPMSGRSTSSNSGYIGKVYPDSSTGYIDSGNTLAFPDAKYYDLYANGTTYNNQTAYNRSHLGDATGETRSWYSDRAFFPRADDPWFLRGGSYNDGSGAGVFGFNSAGGGAPGYGYRVALSTTGA